MLSRKTAWPLEFRDVDPIAKIVYIDFHEHLARGADPVEKKAYHERKASNAWKGIL